MKTRNLVWSAALALLGATSAWTYTLQYASGHYLRWVNKTSDKPVTIKMVTNYSFPTQSNFNDPNIVRAVVQKVMGQWNDTLSANGIPITYSDGGVTTTTQNVACDAVNVITFTNADPTTQLSPGVLATAFLQSFPTQAASFYPGVGTCGTTNVPLNFPEQVVDADIEFNTNLVFTTNGSIVSGAVANDIEATLRHEMGHVLGLHHSGIVTSLMVPNSQQTFPFRGLSTDEVAGINAAYGVNVLGGAISGTVTDSLSVPVFGAHVVLVDTATGFPTVSALTDKTGAYSMVGFAPGTYKLYVEPLDGPVNIALLGQFPVDVFGPTLGTNSAFGTAFVSGTVKIVKGTPTTGMNVTVPAAKSGNASSIAVINVTSGNGLSGATVSAARGTQVVICMIGTTVSGEITTSEPNGKIVPVGATNPSQTACSGSPSRTFNIDASTPVGFYDLYSNNTAMAGALFVTTNPTVGVGGIVEGANFGQTSGTAQIAPGSIVSIFGTDLTPSTILGSGFPVETQLGGLSVRFADRWAPLYYVAPGQLNAMVPYEVSGTVAVQVESGNNTVFKAGTINVVASAPRLFLAGDGSGAIQNGSHANVPVSPANPAAGGDVLVIYAEGLGQTSPAAPTGIAAASNPQITDAGFLVMIGGQSAAIDYKGVAPGFTGLYQINAHVPAGLPANNATQIYLQDGKGNKSNTATIALK